MNILITNDDGIFAPGLQELARVAQKFGKVKVFAPDRQRSACGHSLQLFTPMRMSRVDYGDIEAYKVNATPTDCVNLGFWEGWDSKCDLVLSGINEGPNLGLDMTYSGTVAGAMQGAICGCRSISVSIGTELSNGGYKFETAGRWLEENLQMLLDLPIENKTITNVNVPMLPFEELKGHKFVKIGPRSFDLDIQKREDPWGYPYHWYCGEFGKLFDAPNTDVEAVHAGFVSVSPITIDWTNYETLEKLNKTLTNTTA